MSNIPLSVPILDGNEWKYIKECLDTEWVSSAGKYVDLFEEKVAEFEILRQQKVANLDNVVNYGRKKILDKLTLIIADIANEREINIVLEKRLVLVGASSLDITNDVLKNLDQRLNQVTTEVSELIQEILWICLKQSLFQKKVMQCFT